VGAPESLLDAKQIADLGGKAIAQFRTLLPLGFKTADDETQLAIDAAYEVMMACAACIAHLRDPSLLPLALEIIDCVSRIERHGLHDDPDVATAGIRELAKAKIALSEIADLANDGSANIRMAVAASFPIDKPEHLAVVVGLAGDEDAAVSAAAKSRLENVDLPFWMGKFSMDPFSVVPEKQARALKKHIERICKLLEREHWYGDKEKNAFFAAAKKLPPKLQADVLMRAHLGGRMQYGGRDTIAQMLAQLGDEGVRAFEAIVSSPKLDWGAHFFAEQFGKTLPREHALRVIPSLVERACAATVDDAQIDSVAHCLAVTAGKAWPEDVDPTPILDAILERPLWEPYDPVANALDDAIGRSKCVAVLRPKIEAALLAGFPDKWQELRSTALTWLQNLPKKQLRAVAEPALDCGIDSTIGWALKALLEEAYDKSRDPPKAKLAIRFDDDPRSRRAMRLQLTDRILPRLRDELAAGVLDFDVGVRVICEIGTLFGGTLSDARWFWLHASIGVRRAPKKLADDVELVSGNPRARKLHKPFLGPKKYHRPPNEAEWNAYRAARDRHTLSTDEDFALALRALPYEDGWAASDRAFFDRALSHVRERRTSAKVDLILLAAAPIAKKSDARDLALLEEICSIAEADPEDENGTDAETIVFMLKQMRARLGVAEEQQQTRKESEDEWLDQS